jgi:hypothetical protein
MSLPSRRFSWLFSGLACLLIGIFFVQILSESRVKSPSSDEPPHIASGLSYVSTGIFRGNPQHPPLMKELSGLSLLLGGIRWPRNPQTEFFLHGPVVKGYQPEWAIGNKLIADNGPDRVLFWARLPFILVGCLLAAVIFLWGRQVLGTMAALGAVFLCTVDPGILAHSFMVTMDVPVTAFSLLFFFALWNYVRYPSVMRLLWCGLALGLALGAKFSAVLLIPLAAALLLAAVLWPPETDPGRPLTWLDPFHSRFHMAEAKPAESASAGATIGRNQKCPCGSGKKYKACHGKTAVRGKPAEPLPAETGRRVAIGVCALLGMGLIAFVIVYALYFFPLDPLVYFRGIQKVNADHISTFPAFLAGKFQPRFAAYFPAVFLLKESIASIVLATIGAVVLIRNRAVSLIGKVFVLLPPAVIFVGHIIFADDLGLRYILLVIPFAHLLGGLALAAMVQAQRRWVRGAALFLCAWLVMADAGIYPDHLSYFNEAACLPSHSGQIGLDGGSACGTYWLDDSNVDWGQGLKQLKAWLDRSGETRTVRLANPFGFPSEPYHIRAQPVTVEELARGPVPGGIYAVSAHLVARMSVWMPGCGWLRTVPPRAVVGHALYIYDIPPNL